MVEYRPTRNPFPAKYLESVLQKSLFSGRSIDKDAFDRIEKLLEKYINDILPNDVQKAYTSGKFKKLDVSRLARNGKTPSSSNDTSKQKRLRIEKFIRQIVTEFSSSFYSAVTSERANKEVTFYTPYTLALKLELFTSSQTKTTGSDLERIFTHNEISSRMANSLGSFILTYLRYVVTRVDLSEKSVQNAREKIDSILSKNEDGNYSYDFYTPFVKAVFKGFDSKMPSSSSSSKSKPKASSSKSTKKSSKGKSKGGKKGRKR